MEKKLLNSIGFKCDVCRSYFLVEEGAEEKCQQCIENGDQDEITAVSPKITEESVILFIETLSDMAETGKDRNIRFSSKTYENWAKNALGWE